MKHKLVIWGASGHALVVSEIIRLRGEYEIIGFVDDLNPERHNTFFDGLRILGGIEQLDILRSEGVENIILGFGDCQARLRLAAVAREKGYVLATAIHPRAIVSESARIGAGTLIAAGAVVAPHAEIGENVIVNTMASVDHECVVEDGVHICPGVHLAGKVSVGRASWLSIGVIVMDRIRVGEGSMIGAGAVVVNDIPDRVLAYGVPAKVVSSTV